MKQLVVLLSLCLAGTSAAVFAQRSPAAPKRLLLVTTTVGFRHAAVPLQERMIRDLAKSTGEFTVVSTTDSPDFPAAAYQAVVDQRNARIPLAEAKDNNMPPPPRPYLEAIREKPARLRVGFSWASPIGGDVHPEAIAAVKDAAKLLVAAENPLIIAGRSARTPKGIELLVELANLLGARVNDQHPFFVRELLWELLLLVMRMCL